MKIYRTKFEGREANPTTDANQSDTDIINKSKPNNADLSNVVKDAFFKKSDRLLRDNEQYDKYHSYKRLEEKVLLVQNANKTEKQEEANIKQYYFKNLIY